jgi:hypothetical protein
MVGSSCVGQGCRHGRFAIYAAPTRTAIPFVVARNSRTLETHGQLSPEDFAPFDVDLTTDCEGRQNDRGIHRSRVVILLLTTTTCVSVSFFFSQNPLFSRTTLGTSGLRRKWTETAFLYTIALVLAFAYFKVFGGSIYASYCSPALVFNTGLSGVSEAISHELGHNLGLR